MPHYLSPFDQLGTLFADHIRNSWEAMSGKRKIILNLQKKLQK